MNTLVNSTSSASFYPDRRTPNAWPRRKSYSSTQLTLDLVYCQFVAYATKTPKLQREAWLSLVLSPATHPAF
jgi:hypothetical protein